MTTTSPNLISADARSADGRSADAKSAGGTSADVIDRLVGVQPDSPLDTVRAQRAQARANAQASYDALFAPEHPGEVSVLERFAVASFVIGLHRDAETADHYTTLLREHTGPSGVAPAIAAEVARGEATGPYGRFPAGPLEHESVHGPHYRVADAHRELLGTRLTAGLEHAHLLVLRPREASAQALQSLLDAGWSATDIVTLSQLVAFLTFQVRVIAGLRALAAEMGESVAGPDTAGPAAAGPAAAISTEEIN